MAKSRIVTAAGAVVLPSGFNLDVQSHRIRESQATENTTIYGGTTYGQMTGNGTPIQQIQAVGFPFKGAGVGTSSPGYGAMAGATGATGSTATFTEDVGCTLSGLYIVSELDSDHSRIAAAARTTITLMNSGDPTPTWATN